MVVPPERSAPMSSAALAPRPAVTGPLWPTTDTGMLLLPDPLGILSLKVRFGTPRRSLHLKPWATGHEEPVSAYVHVANDDGPQWPTLSISIGERLLMAAASIAGGLALAAALVGLGLLK